VPLPLESTHKVPQRVLAALASGGGMAAAMAAASASLPAAPAPLATITSGVSAAESSGGFVVGDTASTAGNVQSDLGASGNPESDSLRPTTLNDVDADTSGVDEFPSAAASYLQLTAADIRVASQHSPHHAHTAQPTQQRPAPHGSGAAPAAPLARANSVGAFGTAFVRQHSTPHQMQTHHTMHPPSAASTSPHHHHTSHHHHQQQLQHHRHHQHTPSPPHAAASPPPTRPFSHSLQHPLASAAHSSPHRTDTYGYDSGQPVLSGTENYLKLNNNDLKSLHASATNSHDTADTAAGNTTASATDSMPFHRHSTLLSSASASSSSPAARPRLATVHDTSASFHPSTTSDHSFNTTSTTSDDDPNNLPLSNYLKLSSADVKAVHHHASQSQPQPTQPTPQQHSTNQFDNEEFYPVKPKPAAAAAAGAAKPATAAPATSPSSAKPATAAKPQPLNPFRPVVHAPVNAPQHARPQHSAAPVATSSVPVASTQSVLSYDGKFASHENYTGLTNKDLRVPHSNQPPHNGTGDGDDMPD
jgi:hypothetical protein